MLRHRPQEPEWPERDRVFWSGGHKAPALYVALGRAGYFPLEETMLLRQLNSPMQGHPNRLELPGVELSTGSLGQGLGAAVGCALAARLDGKDYRVFCIMGDGEQQEGSVWEAVMAAGHYQLGRLVAIIDRNGLQIDGRVCEVMNIESLEAKYQAFGWNVISINGHDMRQCVEALEATGGAATGKPTVIIADTVKGKGISFMEDQAGWHGIAPKKEDLEKALPELRAKFPGLTDARVKQLLAKAKDYAANIAAETRALVPGFSRDYWWNAEERMKVEMDPTRFGFGRGLEQAGEDPRVVTLHADISASIKITDFETGHPERQNRVFSVGIAEQNMMSVAAGLAKEGKIPVTGTYGVFAAGRAWDQIRTTICYGQYNVKIAGAHGGISVGADGPTHQALEEISLMAILPNMTLLVPCDAPETEKATKVGLLEVVGPTYIRYAREATPVVTGPETPFKFGVANVIRYRGAQARFADAFETIPADEYQSEDEEIAIIACGPMVPEAMRAAYILKEEFGLETRVLNVHTVKPIDREAILAAALDTGVVLTAEEHQVGGFGGIVAGVILRECRRPIRFDMVGVPDTFGKSGEPWQLMQYYGLTGEHLAQRAHALHSGIGTAGAGGSLSGAKGGTVATLTTVRCHTCGREMDAEEYLRQQYDGGDLPADDRCAACDHRSAAECLECRRLWLALNPNAVLFCRACAPIA